MHLLKHNAGDYIAIYSGKPVLSFLRDGVDKLPVENSLKLGNKRIMISQMSPDTAHIEPYGGDVVKNDSVEQRRIKIEIDLSVTDRIFGLGERPSRMNRKRSKHLLYSTSAWDYNTKKEDIYSSFPVFYILDGTNAYMVFLNYPGEIEFDFGIEKYHSIIITFQSGNFELFLAHAKTMKEVVGTYVNITGRPFEIPEWALGHQISRWSYFPESSVKDIVDRYLDKFPVSAVYLDIDYMDQYRVFTWDSQRFPDPEGLVRYLKNKGVKLVPILDPGIKLDQNFDVFRNGLGNYLEDPSGSLYVDTVWPGTCVFPDFLNESARNFWSEEIVKFLRFGIEGIWLDMNEPAVHNAYENGKRRATILKDAMHRMDDGTRITDFSVHNLYAYYEAQATYFAMLSKIERPFILTRSGYPGIQKYAAMWTGDNLSSYEDVKLQISMVLSLSISGMPYCGCDLGGFWGDSEPDLLSVYYEAALFFPIYRNHKIKNANEQELFLLPAYYQERILKAINTRYKFLPYIMELARKSSSNGEPIIRPLFYDYPNDSDAYSVEDEYMLGESVLHAPVIGKDQRVRGVYLPKGKWVSYWTGEVYDGPTVIDSKERMGIYVREIDVERLASYGIEIPQQSS